MFTTNFFRIVKLTEDGLHYCYKLLIRENTVSNDRKCKSEVLTDFKHVSLS